MKRKINIKILLGVTLFVLSVLNAIVFWNIYLQNRSVLKVAFLDIGQGDAIFIETPSKHKVLVDAGPNGARLLQELGAQMRFWDKYLDVIIATHADKDHIGGFIDLLKYYKVGAIYSPPDLQYKQSGVVEPLLLNIARQQNRGAKKLNLSRGSVIDFGDGVKIVVYFPKKNLPIEDSNASSIVLKVVYGDTSFLLTGDSPKNIERALSIIDKNKLKSDVLKLGHHGSRTSSSFEFLNFVHPKWAIISAGAHNKYGHPHKEVLNRLDKLSIKYLNTAKSGTIVFESDGQNLKVLSE